MSHLRVKKVEDNMKFKWGRKKGVSKTDERIQFYESFTYEDVEYFVYDCAYIYCKGDTETSICKLVKMFETPTHAKRVKVVWFRRPIDIRDILGNHNPQWNELFLASGQGVGCQDYINPLEVIVGKCSVVCTSKDERNPQASKTELKWADYFFYRTVDVEKCVISEKFKDEIAGIKVEYFFNKRKDTKLISPSNLKRNIKTEAGRSILSSKIGLVEKGGSAVNTDNSGNGVSPVLLESKRAMTSMGENRRMSNENSTLRPKATINKDGTEPGQISFRQDQDEANVRSSDSLLPMNESDTRPNKKRKLLLDGQKKVPKKGEDIDGKAGNASDKMVPELAGNRGAKTHAQFLEVTRRPDADRSSWFKKLPWDQRLQTAEEMGTLVLLDNLDPSYTSLEVEDLVWHAFNRRVEAKMIQQGTFSHPHYGKALVIFKSNDAAEDAISKLQSGCLILEDGRPVVGCKGTLIQQGEPAKFFGHLVLDVNKRQRQRDEKRNAVATSHSSQPNTIEYDFAMEWRHLQEWTDICWRLLFEAQAKEMQELRSQLKSTEINELT
uniref:BAH domain-containing protein n=1 Tax=Quercus lobata TaxID=97700 RepID=A0A7N2LPS8_QUELO